MDVDDVLSYVGNFGRFQISLVALFSFMEFPNGLLIMSPYFVEENPAWKCVKNSSVCRKNGTFSVGQQGYEIRCEMPRDAWSYVKKNDFSIVTQVRISSISYARKISRPCGFSGFDQLKDTMTPV